LLYEDQKTPVKKDDFMYLPVGIKHGMANASNQPVRLLAMGFKMPLGAKLAPTPKLMLANAADVSLVPCTAARIPAKLLLIIPYLAAFLSVSSF